MPKPTKGESLTPEPRDQPNGRFICVERRNRVLRLVSTLFRDAAARCSNSERSALNKPFRVATYCIVALCEARRCLGRFNDVRSAGIATRTMKRYQRGGLLLDAQGAARDDK